MKLVKVLFQPLNFLDISSADINALAMEDNGIELTVLAYLNRVRRRIVNQNLLLVSFLLDTLTVEFW